MNELRRNNIITPRYNALYHHDLCNNPKIKERILYIVSRLLLNISFNISKEIWKYLK